MDAEDSCNYFIFFMGTTRKSARDSNTVCQASLRRHTLGNRLVERNRRFNIKDNYHKANKHLFSVQYMFVGDNVLLALSG